MIGGGVVGTHAARMAVGLGAEVTILDRSIRRLRELDELFEGRVRLPLHRTGLESEDACARLPPPGRDQIAVNIMSLSNLDNTGPRHETLLHYPKLLGSGPSPSPLWTGQNLYRRHVCSFVCKVMSKASHSGNAAFTGGCGSRL